MEPEKKSLKEVLSEPGAIVEITLLVILGAGVVFCAYMYFKG